METRALSCIATQCGPQLRTTIVAHIALNCELASLLPIRTIQKTAPNETANRFVGCCMTTMCLSELIAWSNDHNCDNFHNGQLTPRAWIYWDMFASNCNHHHHHHYSWYKYTYKSSSVNVWIITIIYYCCALFVVGSFTLLLLLLDAHRLTSSE